MAASLSNTGSSNAANTFDTYIAVLYTATQYTANYSAGQNNVINSQNTYSLYTLSQVQALTVMCRCCRRIRLPASSS